MSEPRHIFHLHPEMKDVIADWLHPYVDDDKPSRYLFNAIETALMHGVPFLADSDDPKELEKR